MGHGHVKKASLKGQTHAEPHPQSTDQQFAGHYQDPPKVAGREKPVVWEDDNELDIVDITFVVPIMISIIILAVFLFRKYIRWTVPCSSDNRIEGKTVIITGANTGIGRATATELARRGGRIILGCRDKTKGEAVALQIRNKTKNQEVFCYELDLASLKSVKNFAEYFSNKEPALHVLINNAAFMGPKAITDDGYERAFGVNYLGHFYLTYLLTDKLKRGAPSRIINLVSDSYSKVRLDFEDLAFTNYDPYKAYARSKLALITFTFELHRRLQADFVYSYGVHPGMVCTELMRNWSGCTGNILRACARVFFKSPEDGCQTVVFCAVADKMRELSGKILENCNVYKVKAFTKDHELWVKLWNVSLHLCGLDDQIKMESSAEKRDQSKDVKESNDVEEVGPSVLETKKEK